MSATATAAVVQQPVHGAARAPLAFERVAALPSGDAADGVLGALDYCGAAAGAAAAAVDRIGLAPLGGTADRIDVWRSAAPVTEGRSGAVRWRSGGGWLHGSIAVDDDAASGAGIEALAERVYRDLFAVLDATGHRHLLRLWNYLPSIHADDAGLERYRRFNVGRRRAFVAAGRGVQAGAPAACALGVRGGPLRVAFLAGQAPPLAVENPRQVPAWRYPPDYGPASPTFSRAALADAGGGRLALFVSGTASIVGHLSLHPGDVEAQTRETLANLDAVVAAARARCSAAFAVATLAPVVYVRRPDDAPRVRAVLESALGADAPALRDAVFVQGDVCRGELLVEVEAHALLPGALRGDAAQAAACLRRGSGDMTSPAIAGAAVLAGALLALPAAHAAERPLWELGVGAAGLYLPHYRGSDQSHAVPLPVPYVIYRGAIFRADREGARAVLYERGDVDLDLSLAASLPTRSGSNRAREGMSDLSPTVEFGPNVNWTLARGARWKVALRLPVRAAYTVESRPHMIGWIASPNLNLDLALDGGWKLGMLAGPQYATRRYHGYFYDVPAAAATAARPEYDAPGGYNGARATVALTRRFAGGWLGAFVRHDTLDGAAFIDSPLVRRQSNLSFGVAYAWVFATSSRRVESDD